MAGNAPRAAGGVRLRPPHPADEAAFRTAHEVMARENFVFGLGFEPEMSFVAYLAALAAQHDGTRLPAGWVPASFLVADVGGRLVGRSSIRHRLNDALLREGGHIGYGVLPEHRRHGYATEILRQSLVIARAHGVDRALLTCDEDNLGSRAVIERCGGQLESRTTAAPLSGTRCYSRRYWIS